MSFTPFPLLEATETPQKGEQVHKDETRSRTLRKSPRILLRNGPRCEKGEKKADIASSCPEGRVVPKAGETR